MPNALIRVRLASAMVRSEPTGWNMPWKRTGSPVSTPNGTMSSMSKSIVSPTRTLCRSPSSSTGGHCHFMGGQAEGEEGVRRAVRERVDRDADVIKIMASGGNMTIGGYSALDPQYATAELAAAV